MKTISIILFLLLSTLNYSQSSDFLDKLSTQLLKKQEVLNGKFSDYTINGKWDSLKTKPGWLMGFIGGEFWKLYDLTHNETLKTKAIEIADAMIPFASLDNTHDLGFIFLPSVVQAYRHTKDPKYREAAINAAKMLVKRFNENGNFIRAWGSLKSDDRAGWTIIDTMLNLELLFWATQETGDYTYYDIAYKHALTCLKNTVRNDFSSYHVVEYNTKTGEVISKRTHQGANDNSTWARGQAWGIYGFAVAYKYTQDERFLNASKKMSDYFLNKLPSDLVPYWDLTDAGKDTVRDASAGAIAANGMRILCDYLTVENDYQKYHSAYTSITNSLINNYSFLSSKRSVEQGLLLHTVYNFAKKWGVDESFPCGDYYFVEAISRLKTDANAMSALQFGNRTERLINDNWAYLEDNVKSYADVSKSSVSWAHVNLPHTWNKTDVFDAIPGYRRSASWYKKDLVIEKSDAPSRYLLSFESANIKSEVFVNGVKAGGHVGGFVGFDVDITDFIKFDSQNEICVRVDNSIDREVIPSQKSDFNIYGGINRNVRLKTVPLISISRCLVSVPEVNEKSAEAEVKFSFAKKGDAKNNLSLRVTILDGDKVVSETSSKKVKIENDGDTLRLSLKKVKNPKLWSPDSPTLYTINAELKDGDKLVDSYSDKIGFRYYEFKEKGAFYLNGKRLLLRGTHRHEEMAGYGNAMPDSLHRKDIIIIKELGANFLRLAHYPQSPEIYRSCDELGILLWDEVPWCRGAVGDAAWQANTTRLFKEQILQNFNHPSIILWSIGNESDWIPDYTNGDNSDTMKKFALVMNNLAKSLDANRLTSARKFDAASDVVDVFSPSIWPGWYSTVYKELDNVMNKQRNTVKRLIHIEYGGDSHVGRHTETPVTGEGNIPKDDGQEKAVQLKMRNIANEGDWSESYIVNLFDWYLKWQESTDWLSGSAQWIFRDFGTPLRPENPIPYLNQKGLFDRANNPKDAYYVYKSYWTTNPKFCYIESKTWTFRNGAKNAKRDVKVFSNCSEVELFLNGQSLGKLTKDITKFPASGLLWKVDFAEGANELIAKGFDGGNQSSVDTLKLEFTYAKIEKGEDIVYSSKRLPNGNYLVTVKVVDKNGRQCADFNKFMYFYMTGSGKLVADLGTPTNSSIIQAANGKASIEVKTVPNEECMVEVRTQDFKGHYYKVPH